jgi:CHAT domain-containing protein
VASEEPNIPWELMRPFRITADGRRERRETLGADFAVGRWVHSGHRSPKQQVSIESSYVVAPTYDGSDLRPLPNAQKEAEWVCARFAGKRVTPADPLRLDNLLRVSPVDLLHLVAHGEAGRVEDGAAIPQLLLLDDGAQLDAQQIDALDGLVDGFAARPPLVFVNACDVGRTEPSLLGADGVASAFVEAGACCVVAPLWSVKDSLAHEVAVEFYEAALRDPRRPLAEILSDIRAKAYVDGGGEDTYAAYCFYGDPLTALDATA